MKRILLLWVCGVLMAATPAGNETAKPVRKHLVPSAYFVEHMGQYETPVYFNGHLMAYQVVDVRIENGYLIMESYAEPLAKRQVQRLDRHELYLLTYDRESLTGTFVSHPPQGSTEQPRFYYFVSDMDRTLLSIKEISPEGAGIGQSVQFRKRD